MHCFRRMFFDPLTLSPHLTVCLPQTAVGSTDALKWHMIFAVALILSWEQNLTSTIVLLLRLTIERRLSLMSIFVSTENHVFCDIQTVKLMKKLGFKLRFAVSALQLVYHGQRHYVITFYTKYTGSDAQSPKSDLRIH